MTRTHKDTRKYKEYLADKVNFIGSIPSNFKKLRKRLRKAKEKQALRANKEIPVWKNDDEYDWWQKLQEQINQQIWAAIKDLQAKVEKLEFRKTGRKHAFENSPYFDKNKFKARFPNWPVEKLKHYYQQAQDYSQANGGRYLDWGVAINNWARNNAKNGETWGKTKADYYQAPTVEDPCEQGDIKKILEQVKIKTIDQA